MYKEKRKYQRADIKCKVNVICEGIVILGEPDGYVFHTYTDNISEGGLKVVLERQINTASLVNLQLYITSKVPLSCKGMVVWTNKSNPEGTSPDLYDTGIQFIELSERDKGFIRNVVNMALGKKV